MKMIFCFATLFLIFTTDAFCQSSINYQSNTGLDIQPGADVCADQVQINGSFSGGGTICGSTAFLLNLTSFIEGFYNSVTNSIVPDTINIYLRNDFSPYSVIDSAENVLSTSGSGAFVFLNISNGINYYIEMKHRNSIDTWSRSGLSFTSGALTYNFTTSANRAYGSNQIQIDNSPVRFGIFSGDVNQDGVIDATDAGAIDNDAFNFITGYVDTDLTGDEVVDATDAAIADNNASNFVSAVTP